MYLMSNTYICGGPVNNGGIVLQWLLKNVFGKETSGPEDYDNLFKLIKPIPAGSEGVIFLPYLNGERAPVWDASASGGFFASGCSMVEGIWAGLCSNESAMH